MPDTSAIGWLSTLQGENAMAAGAKRREAAVLREQAATLEREAEWYEERVAWATEALNALCDDYDELPDP